ncbi:hypothetical protein R1sor_005963 [Riccia sorocarpa]|uniref:DUF4283 domain-containing protein n=1 Tax=Riccia sorocarpa TaxID=122646 RepID=A0ABD3HLB4_9MARC
MLVNLGVANEVATTSEDPAKRQREHEQDLLRRSLEFSDFIKRRCNGGNKMADPKLQRASSSRGTGRIIPISPPQHGNVRRGSLFGSRGSPLNSLRGYSTQTNEVFERSPLHLARPGQVGGSPQILYASTAPTVTNRELQLNPWHQNARPPATGQQPIQGTPQRAIRTPPRSPQGSPSNSIGNQPGSLLDQIADSQTPYETGGDDNLSISDTDEERKADNAYMDERRWMKKMMREVTEAYKRLPDRTGEPQVDDVEVYHKLDITAQIRIFKRKRIVEDCGVVFCTVDISPSRNGFQQWIYQEVEAKADVQIRHVKCLAPRHYLVLLHSPEDRAAVMINGPYYMKKRMIYTAEWEPGFNTKRILAKTMACWLDLLNVDPMLEGEGENMLGSLGTVLQWQTQMFAHIRGCVLMDITKPLPTVLTVVLNGEQKQMGIQYDLLLDACFTCHEWGHFVLLYPKTTTVRPAEGHQDKGETDADGFQTVPRRNNTTPIPEATKPKAERRPLDLNSTPAPTQQQKEMSEKQKKEGSKKARKKEARRKKLEEARVDLNAEASRDSSDVEHNSEAEDSSSEEDEAPGFWKNDKGKKAKGTGETMDTTARWLGQQGYGGTELQHGQRYNWGEK